MNSIFWRICRWPLFVILLMASLWLALVSGSYPVTWGDVVHIFMPASDHTLGSNADTQTLEVVLMQIRLPRILAALLVGAALACSGAAYQAMFRNPLVSPDILGVSAGAGLGAVLGIVMGFTPSAIQIMAFSGGLLAVLMVYSVSTILKRHDPVLILVLAGVAVGAFLSAFISLLTILADPYSELASITFWLLGGLGSVSMSDLYRSIPFILFGFVPLVLLRWRINLLSLPDDEAQALGLNTKQLRRILILAATLMTASVVSFAGVIAWVGLIVPHLARLVVGPVFSRLMPAAIMLGAAFMLFTDTIARSASYMEIPLGVLTSLVGAPFFVLLLLYGRRSI